jgi:Ni/Co efflux regulator RcnB
MKKLILSAIAFSMLAVPTVQAQAQGGPRHPQAVERHYDGHKKFDRKQVERKQTVRKPVKHWKRGERVPSWQRKQVVRDYRHHGLKRPPHGQHWVKVDNSYLLIGIASGVIAGLIAGR